MKLETILSERQKLIYLNIKIYLSCCLFLYFFSYTSQLEIKCNDSKYNICYLTLIDKLSIILKL